MTFSQQMQEFQQGEEKRLNTLGSPEQIMKLPKSHFSTKDAYKDEAS